MLDSILSKVNSDKNWSLQSSLEVSKFDIFNITSELINNFLIIVTSELSNNF